MRTPAFTTTHATVYQGDALEVMRDLPEESVDCVVTSPPYWGLRDYGVAGQFGLEKTPAEYVERMVEVFREVRRVLAKRGTVFLNLGDSYASVGGDRNYGSWDGATGRAPGERRVGGSGRRAPQGSLGDGRPSDGLCGACASALAVHTARTDVEPEASLALSPSVTIRVPRSLALALVVDE